MKKIIGEEFKDSKIIFKIEDKFLFNKKEYEESININKISKIEKILESGFDNEITCIIFYQKLTDVEGICIDTLDDEIKNNEAMIELIKEKSVLYKIPASRYIGKITELFDKIIANLDINNIEIIETII